MTKALIVVDTQVDFCEEGNLPVDGGNAVARDVSDLIAASERGTYAVVVATKDHHLPHSSNGGHFARHNPPDFVDTWPEHCVQGTPGNKLHPDISMALFNYDWGYVIVEKGQGEPAFSAFDAVTNGRSLHPKTMFNDLLHNYRVDELDVCGIATDYCVRATVLDALAAGFKVNLLTNLCAGVAEASTNEALNEMRDAGATLT